MLSAPTLSLAAHPTQAPRRCQPGRAPRRGAFAMMLCLAMVAATRANAAHAQVANERSTVDATPKGTIGLGLVGAELGFVIPALAGLHETWAFVTFPIIGAAGGAVGGYFGIDNRGKSKGAVAALVVGASLILPAAVITLAATSYSEKKDEFAEPDAEDARAPAQNAEVAARDARSSRPQQPAQRFGLVPSRARGGEPYARSGLGLLRKGEGRNTWGLGLPTLLVENTFTEEERMKLGARPMATMLVPVASGVF